MADAKPKVVLQPTCDRPEASRRCTALVHRISISQAIVGSVLEVPKVSDTLAKEVLRSHLTGETGLGDVLSRFIVPLDPAKPLDPAETLELIARGMAKQAVVNTEMVIAAAVVVLSHSTADDVFTTALEIAIDLDPNGWLSELSLDYKVSLKQMYEESVEGVLARALRQHKQVFKILAEQAQENNQNPVRKFVLYSLRHTFLTRLGESGCEVWTHARIAGHSDIRMSARYVHPSEDAVLNAMSRLGGHKIGHRRLPAVLQPKPRKQLTR